MNALCHLKKLLPGLIFALLISVHFSAGARSLPDFTGLVERYSPAVVNISTTQKVKRRRGPVLPKGLELPDIPKDSPLHEFFRRFFGEGGEGGQEFNAQSLGSGFIISADGYIITNNHVIKDADEIIVRLSDRRELAARIIGGDPRSDIALLKIEAEDLPIVKTGTDYSLKVGEWVLAIGSPFGFDHSVTAGIVSAKGRSLPSENYVPFIQTDVAINPGNSGGPLFNLDGEVVGVNSQIYSRTGGFMGLSFAIPIADAMNVVEQLRDNGKVSRGWLGVMIQDVTRELAESFGMDKPKGALIAKVLPDSPAEQAGLQVGDVVLKFNGKQVKRSSDLPPLVGRTREGVQVPVRVLRGGKKRTLQVLIAELPEEETLAAKTDPETTTDHRLGLVVRDIDATARKRYKVAKGGVLVAIVEEGPARQAGIHGKDVLLMLNGKRIKDRAHFEQLAKELPAGRAISVYLQRAGNPMFLPLRVPQ